MPFTNFKLTRMYVYGTLCPNRCEPSIEVNMKMGSDGGRVLRCSQGGCERDRRIEVIAKI